MQIQSSDEAVWLYSVLSTYWGILCGLCALPQATALFLLLRTTRTLWIPAGPWEDSTEQPADVSIKQGWAVFILGMHIFNPWKTQM